MQLSVPSITTILNIVFIQDAELAWHFFLPAITSGYMYYGAVEDMPVKQTVACNNSLYHAQKSINQ